MQNNNVLVYLEEGSKDLFEKTIALGTRKIIPFDYKSIGNSILETETKSGYAGMGILRKKFAIGHYTPAWISKKQPEDIRQRIKIDNHPVHKEPVIFSSFKRGIDIPLTGQTSLEKNGFERIEFDGTIHNALEQYNLEKKGKISLENDKSLIIILTENNLKSAEEHGLSLENLY